MLTLVFDKIYCSCIREALPPNAFRKVDAVAYNDGMETYVEALVGTMEDKLGLCNLTTPTLFQMQILSKLRFLTTNVLDSLCHLPVFSLHYCLDVLSHWSKLHHSLRKVS